MNYIDSQKNILKEVLAEIRFLKKKDGHIDFFNRCKGMKGWPHHPMRELSIGSFNSRLNHKIDGNSTLNLKQLLMQANDKIVILNEYRKPYKKDKVNSFWQDQIKDGNVEQALEDLEGFLNKAKNEINTKFKVRLD